ncbi:flavodoxin [Methanobrevibacter cuticularis]|uniref:Flavodoxin n=1 Tax=Methanobrevibacter cuticularis TaxID=47311 RepID=A0A166FCL7_9EURY|nr:flavodoxin [Methanobrevibacter cuticularis]KZX17538.1 flavodoxin [Methanobrevibacter cuticularis]
MKILVAYYSRTSVTAKVAEKIQRNLNCDIEEIIDTKNRSGALNYFLSAFEAMRGKPSEIEPIKNDPSEYDLVIIGTPVWASTMASSVLRYILDNKSKFKNLAFFCTCGGSGYEKTLEKMEEVSEKTPLKTFYKTNANSDSELESKINEFTEYIKNKL